jgi:hypothetical protein
LAQISGNSRNRPNNKLKKLEAMQELRQLLIEGNSPAEIQIKLNLSKRTYYRWQASIFSKDIEVLRKVNEDEVLTQCALLRDRLNDVYMTLDELSKDRTISAEERISACITRAQVARNIPKLYSEGPSFVAMQNRKKEEEAVKQMMQRLETGWRQQMMAKDTSNSDDNDSSLDARFTEFARNIATVTASDSDQQDDDSEEEEITEPRPQVLS